MEDLFRITLVRPADPRSEVPPIKLAEDSEFQREYAAAATASSPRAELKKVARQFVSDGRFIAQPSESPMPDQFRTWTTWLDENAEATRDDLAEAIKDIFGADADTLDKRQDFDETLSRLRDSILAIKQLPDLHTRPVAALTEQLRDAEVVRKLSRDSSFPSSFEELNRYRHRSLQLPEMADLRSILSIAKAEELRQKELERQRAERIKQVKELSALLRRLRAAIDELTVVLPSEIDSTPAEAFTGIKIPDELRAARLATQSLRLNTQIADAALAQIKQAAANPNGDDVLLRQDLSGGLSAARLTGQVKEHPVRPLKGTPAFNPIKSSIGEFRLTEAGFKRLSESTRILLIERDLKPTEVPVPYVIERLTEESQTTSGQLQGLTESPVRFRIRQVGARLIRSSIPVPSPFVLETTGLLFRPDFLTDFLPPSVPTSKGEVVPAGVADLLLVRQQLVGYEGADVAHIENILRGERKKREHLSRREVVETTFRESEFESVEESELSQTDRFEMSRETSETIREEIEAKAGAKISGKYGPTVEFEVTAEASYSRSREEATRSAASFAQEMTQRSAEKISNRVLQRVTRTVTTETSDANIHEIDNTSGDGHIAGVYQWVTKVYQAQMFNYGLRTMFDFMIPEPAAFLMHAFASPEGNHSDLKEPPEFTLEPGQITESNYGWWVHQLGATDVPVPPPSYITVTHNSHAGEGDRRTDFQHSVRISIDDGYEAVRGHVMLLNNYWDEDREGIWLSLGRQVRALRNGSIQTSTISLDLERGSIPFGLVTHEVSDYAVTVEIHCRRTNDAVRRWQHAVHAALTSAYQARYAEYQEQLAAALLDEEEGVRIDGRNPALNQQLIREELRKYCISVLTNQHFDIFDGIQENATGRPQINFPVAADQGAYIRFFEQAFEWEHISWVMYPYFWGRGDLWKQRVTFEDVDPEFNEFLKAGSCRVSVPARRGFEGAIDHFLTYGEVWEGGPLPTISSETFLPIAEEIAERLDQPGEEMPQGEPWQVRVPTTLARLRSDDQLPKWEQQPDGSWTEA